MEAKGNLAPKPSDVRAAQERHAAIPHESVTTVVSSESPLGPESRKVRRRAHARTRSPRAIPAETIAEPTDSTAEIDTSSPENQYDENQQWAIAYAKKHLELFDPASNTTYLETDETGEQVIAEKYVPLVNALEDLVLTRTKLAEVNVSLRNGKTLSSDTHRENSLNAAEQTYQDAREAVAKEILTVIPTKTLLAKKQALLAEFSAREDGALMGEEANYYLDRQDTRFQRSLEWYRERSRKEKIAIAIGGAAVIGVIGAVGGLVVGGAAAGGTIGARFGRGYFKREADRKDSRSLLEKQQNATLRTANHDEFLATSDELRDTRNWKILLKKSNNQSEDRITRDRSDYLDEAKKESEAKRKSLYWALGGIAIGASAGYVLEDVSDWVGTLHDHAETGGTNTLPGPDETQNHLSELQEEHERLLEEKAALLQEKANLLEQQNSALAEQLQAAQEAASAEAQHLYGEFAGDTVSLDIPSGSNLWDQLELQVDQQNPFTSFDEKQRLVGNMLNVLKDQNPGRDLNLVYPGEHFDIVLPA